jgi:hypothetical protein
MTGAEFDELRARSDRTCAAAERVAHDLNPDLAVNLGEARKIVAKRQSVRSHINAFTVGGRVAQKTFDALAKAQATVATATAAVAWLDGKVAHWHAQSKQSRGLEQQKAHDLACLYENGKDWVAGTLGGERPGSVIEYENTHALRVSPLKICQEALERADADVTVAMAQLRDALDSWDRRFGAADVEQQPEVASVK